MPFFEPSQKNYQAHVGQRWIIAAQIPAKRTIAPAKLKRVRLLLEARSIIVLELIVQRRGVSRAPRPGGSKVLDQPLSSAFFFGPGKAQEIADTCAYHNPDALLVCNPLGSRHLRNLQRIINCPIYCLDLNNF
jgi:hypothetical protein